MRRSHSRHSASHKSGFASVRRQLLRLGALMCPRGRLFWGGLLVIAAGAPCFGFAAPTAAAPAIVVDAATGDVLFAEQAVEPWYPASLTKLMTFYVAMSAVRDHKISLDTPLVVSARAAAAAPSKMGFKPGTEVTLGNALKMMVVKSANDIAIVVAEGIAGSVEAFAEDMNTAAAELGMRQSHFVNPNGLPNSEHVTSAHDLALLARAIYVSFPQEAEMFGIGALRLGDQIIPTHNTLLGRYPGVDGMKTGFTCAAGFNLIASAQRNGHRYIAVVLGAPNVKLRMLKTAVLLDRAFDGIDHPEAKLAALDDGSPGTAPDMHNQICRRRAKAAAAFQAEIAQLEAPLLAHAAGPTPGLGMLTGAAASPLTPIAPTIALAPKPVFDPMPVYVGPAPGYQGPVAQERPAHSPVGTPAPVSASVVEGPQPQGLAASPPPKPEIRASAAKAHRHVAHKATAKHAAKAAREAKSKHKVAKLEAGKKETAVSRPSKKGAAKAQAATKLHPIKSAKKITAKKHVAKRAATKDQAGAPAAAPAAQ